MSDRTPDYWPESRAQVREALAASWDPEAAVRAVAQILRERHPELLGLRSAESIAERFHAAYESLAPEFGYTTREASRVTWEDVPVQNRDLMVATVQRLLDAGVICGEPPWTPVAEGLPEEDGRYLVTMIRHYEKKPPETHVARWEVLGGELADLRGVWLGLPPYASSDCVLAWRPAPAPWTGGGE